MTKPGRKQDESTFRAFWIKHALGSKTLPSCFSCGAAKQREQWAITHGELPDIYICAECVRARDSNKALLACAQRAITESARVHPDFMDQLRAAIYKATS